MQSFKILLFTTLMVASTYGFSQVQLGVKFSPGVTKSAVTTNSSSFNVADEKGGLRFIGGLVVDLPFAENYYFSTGLNYEKRRSSFTLQDINAPEVQYKEDYSIGYVQIPLTLKMYTNEVAIDKKVYFQLGTMLDFKVDDNINEKTNPLIEKFFFADTGLIISSGLEMNMGTNTKLFGGLTFQKGFVNMAAQNAAFDGENEVTIKNSFVGIEIGVKF